MDAAGIESQLAEILKLRLTQQGIEMAMTLRGKRRTDMSPAMKIFEKAARLGTEEAQARVVNGTQFGAQLKRPDWIVRGLQIVCGRPTVIGGFGSAGKSMIAQSLALAVANGTKLFGHFAVRQGRVLHLDYEQGFDASEMRYVRLGRGYAHAHGDPSFTYAHANLSYQEFPTTKLSSPDALQKFIEMCTGYDLVIVDSLRGATAGVDENDSRIRDCLDVCTKTSSATGAAFVILHHSKKGDGSDLRMQLRGSGAIYDGSGAIFMVDAGARLDGTKLVKQTRASEKATGGCVAPFRLRFVDDEMEELLPEEGDEPAICAVHLEYLSGESDDEGPDSASGDPKHRPTKLDELLMEVIRGNPGIPEAQLIQRSEASRGAVRRRLRDMEEWGSVVVTIGPRGAKQYAPKGDFALTMENEA